MRVLGLQIENVKKIKAVNIVTEGDVIKIAGANEQGKTTVMDALWWAIAGTKNIQDVPIRQGQEKAHVVVDLGEMIVTRKFTAAGSTIEVRNKEGLRYPSPQKLLDDLISKFSFDPLAFAKQDKKDQMNTLLGLVELKVDLAKLSAICGTAIAARDNPLLSIKEAEVFIAGIKTDINRDLTRAKKTLESMQKVDFVAPVNLADLVQERDGLNDQQREIDYMRTDLQAMQTNVRNVDDEIVLQTRLAIKLRDELAEAEKKLEEFKVERVLEFERYTDRQVFVAQYTDIDFADINERISTADEVNKQAEAHTKYKDQLIAVAQHEAEHKMFTGKAKEVSDYKSELVKSAKFPIEGLSFGEDCVEYQGLPFKQSSSAQELQVSLSIAMSMNPKLRVLRINDGSLLDKKHMAVIEAMAKEHDFQIWMEVVDESGKVGIWIEDGEVRPNIVDEIAK